MKVCELIEWLSALPAEANIYTKELGLSQPRIIFYPARGVYAIVVDNRQWWEMKAGAVAVERDGTMTDEIPWYKL